MTNTGSMMKAVVKIFTYMHFYVFKIIRDQVVGQMCGNWRDSSLGVTTKNCNAIIGRIKFPWTRKWQELNIVSLYWF